MSPHFSSLKTYDRFISWSRKGILVLLGGFFITLISWSSFMRVAPEEVKFVNLKSEAILENHMEKPFFSSLNEKGDPYELWADKAKNTTKERVDLINPRGKIFNQQEGRLTEIQAIKGHYTKDKHFLVLQGHVVIKEVLEGYTVKTAEAFVDLKNQQTRGNSPVQGEGPTGSFSGKSFWVNKATGDLYLHGPAQLVMIPQKTSAPQKVPVRVNAMSSITCSQEHHRCTATQQTKTQRGENTLYADKAVAHFSKTASLKDREVVALEAQGHVRFEGKSHTAFGQKAFYEVNEKRILLTGDNLKILTEKQELTAQESLAYFDEEKKAVAKGKALFIEQDRVIQADTLTAYFKPQHNKSAASSDAPQLELDFVLADGEVIISTPDQVARGDHGRYEAGTQQATLRGNTEVAQGKNLIQGTVVKVDFKKNTAVVQQKGESGQQPSRVQALLVPRDIQKQKTFFQKKSNAS